MMLLLRRIPFTILLCAVIVAAGIYGRSHVGPLDTDLHWASGHSPRLLLDGHWHRLVTSILFTAGGWHFYASIVMLTLCVGWLEFHEGVQRTMVVFFGSHLLTLLISDFGIALPLAYLRFQHGKLLFHANDVGPSAGYYGCLGFAVGVLTGRKLAAAAGVVGLVLMSRLIVSGSRSEVDGVTLSADLAHMIAFSLGVASRWWNKKTQIVQSGQ